MEKIWKPADSSIQSKETAFCSELPFGILSFNSYLDIESMNVISSRVEINEYKLWNIESLDFMCAFMKLEILDYLQFYEYLDEAGYDFIDLEFIDIHIYDELKVYVAIKNYMNAVKQLKELKELELLRQSEINQIENATKIKLNVLNNEIHDILEDLDDSNGIGAHNHLVCKRTLNHLVKLAKWLSYVVSTYLYGAFDCMLLSRHVPVSEWIYTL